MAFGAYAPRVGFAEGVQDRAKDLAKAVQAVLDETGAAKIHIIAHSMGGLDSRHMIVDEKMQDAVATLTTIGTPHLGTRFADAGLDAGGEEIIDRVLRDLRMDFTGVKDLTGESRERFNQRAAPSEASNPVHYITYSASQALEHTFKALKLSWKVIDKKEGDNDGLVSITSQKWTERLKGENVEKKVEQFAFPIEADHLNQLGWWDIDELKGVGLFNFQIEATDSQLREHGERRLPADRSTCGNVGLKRRRLHFGPWRFREVHPTFPCPKFRNVTVYSRLLTKHRLLVRLPMR